MCWVETFNSWDALAQLKPPQWPSWNPAWCCLASMVSWSWPQVADAEPLQLSPSFLRAKGSKKQRPRHLKSRNSFENKDFLIMLHCICFGLRFARPNAWMNWDEFDHVLQVQLLLFVCCVGTLVLKKALQLDGLLHHGATLSFDVAYEYHNPRSCLIAGCPIVRGCHVPRQRISPALDDHRCDFHRRPCHQQGSGKGWTNMVSVHLGLLQAVHWRRPPDRDHCLGRFLVS